jgi:hypothetical protein
MSFWGNVWGGLKSVGSAITRPITNLISSMAPSVGSALGSRVGGPSGQQLGSALGNMVSGLTGGSHHNLASGMSSMGQHLASQGAADYTKQMPAWLQNSRAGEVGANAGSRAGSWLGGQAASFLPKSFQHLTPDVQQLGADFGRVGGNLMQKYFGPQLSPQAAATTMADMPGYGGKIMGARAFNRTPQGKQAALENMQGFAELPGLAHGGYMGHYAHGGMNDHYAYGGHPYHYDMGGPAPMMGPGTMMPNQMMPNQMMQNPSFADGGYVQNPGYMLHGHHVMANRFSPMPYSGPHFDMGGPITLRDAVEMLPIA